MAAKGFVTHCELNWRLSDLASKDIEDHVVNIAL